MSMSCSPEGQRTKKAYHAEQQYSSVVDTGRAADIPASSPSVPQLRRQFPRRASMNQTPEGEATMPQEKSKSQKHGEEELLQVTYTPRTVSTRRSPSSIHQQCQSSAMIPCFDSLQATGSRHPREPAMDVFGKAMESSDMLYFGEEGGDDSDAYKKLPKGLSAADHLRGDSWRGVSPLSSPRLDSGRPETSRSSIANFRHRLRRLSGADRTPRSRRTSVSGQLQDRRGSKTLDETSVSDFSHRLGFGTKGFSSQSVTGLESKRPVITRKLQEREAEFTTVNGVGIFCGTWNVNAKRTDCSNPRWLQEWLCPKKEHGDEATSFDGFRAQGHDGVPWSKGGATSPSTFSASGETGQGDGMQDVYAIGLQEVVDLNAVNVAIDIKSRARKNLHDSLTGSPEGKRSMEWEDMLLSTLNFAAWEAKHGPSLETTLPGSPPAAKAPNTNAFFERPGVSTSMNHRQEMLLESKTISKPVDFSALTKTTSNDIQNPGTIDDTFRLSACKGVPPDGCAHENRHRTSDERVNPRAGAAIMGKTFSRSHGVMGSLYRGGGGDGRRNDVVSWDHGNQQDAAMVKDKLIPTQVWSDEIANKKENSNKKQREGYEKSEPGKQKRQQQRQRQQKREPTFVLIAKEHLVGTWLAVFARSSMLPHIRGVRTGTVPAGLMGVLGNKGGVGIRLRLRDSSICYICSHLAAHRDNVQARNNNYLKILREMTFYPPDESECNKEHKQRRRRHRKRFSSPGSPRFLRRFSTNTDPPQASTESRRRLSFSSCRSLSISKLRSRSFSPLSASKDAPLVARSSSLSSSPRLDSGKSVNCHHEGHHGLCLTPQFPVEFEQSGIGAICQRCEILSMPNATSSLSKASSYICSSLPTTTSSGRTGTNVTAGGVALGAPASSPIDLPPQLTIKIVAPGSSAGDTTGYKYITADLSLEHNNAKVEQSSLPSGAIHVTTPRSASPINSTCDTRDKRQAYRGTDSLGLGGRDVAVTRERFSLASGSVGAEASGFNLEASDVILGDSSQHGPGKREGKTCVSRQNVGVLRDKRRCSSGTETHWTRKNEVYEAISSRLGVDSWEGESTAWSSDGSISSVDSEEEIRKDQGEIPMRGCVPQLGVSSEEKRLWIQDHDVVFWFGDLNYRINSAIAATEVLRHAQAESLQFLSENDQLRSAREAGDAFVGFQEGRIDFLPTYKYTVGTDKYDLRNDRKFRAPAWCDRVLFWTSALSFHTSDAKGLGAGEVVQLGYRRSETPSTSDHKPVSASFRFGCKKIDAEKYTEIAREIIDDVSKGPGDDRPQIDIDEGSEIIDFGDVRYDVPKSRTVIMKNSGGTAACFTAIFSERDSPSRRQHPIVTGPREPRDSSWEAVAGKEVFSVSSLLVLNQISAEGDSHRQLSLCEDGMLQEHPWYSVFPDRSILLPGESLKITFRLLIEDSAARALASGRLSTRLRDTLVLKMDQGNDSRFSLTASYIPSVYGSSLETMVGKAADDAAGGGDHGHFLLDTGTLRFCPKKSVAPQWADVNDIAPTEAAASVPRQIARLVEFILQDERKCQQPRLFIEEGVDEEVWSIREALDSDTEFSPHCTHSTIEALITLLASLSPAVIPEGACPYHSEASDSKLVQVDTIAFLRSLPPVNRAVFIYLIRFFRSLLAHSSKNGLTVDRMVFVQRSCLLPDAQRPFFASGDPQGVHDRGSLGRETSDLYLSSRSRDSRGVRTVSKGEDRLGKVLRYLLTNESTWL